MSSLAVAALAVSVATPVALYILYKRFEYPRVVEETRSEISKIKSEISNLTSFSPSNSPQLDELAKRVSSLEERLGAIEKKVAAIESSLNDLNTKIGAVAQNEDDDIAEQVIRLRQQGYSLRRIAEELETSVSRVRKILKERNMA
ncbi:MAG: hypothetical protein QXG81_00965 [Ignisphaera sp.]